MERKHVEKLPPEKAAEKMARAVQISEQDADILNGFFSVGIGRPSGAMQQTGIPYPWWVAWLDESGFMGEDRADALALLLALDVEWLNIQAERAAKKRTK